MIPRYQRVLFWCLFGCILFMFAFLLRGCEQAREKFADHGDLTPLASPTPTELSNVTLSMASDADVSLTPTTRQIALPGDPGLKARALLESLVSLYAQPGSAHPLQSGAAVDDVYLFTPAAASGAQGSRQDSLSQARGGLTAVVNLRGSFADHHPSGVVVETLTVQSMIGTLHATLPEIEQIRFLVDGKPRETLAGHASLLRAYPAVDTVNRPPTGDEK